MLINLSRARKLPPDVSIRLDATLQINRKTMIPTNGKITSFISMDEIVEVSLDTRSPIRFGSGFVLSAGTVIFLALVGSAIDG